MISMYSASAPVFGRMLGNLQRILDKAEADAAARKIDPLVFVNSRLAPDMLPLKKQIQLATDHAKGAVSRLAGREVPSWPDTEETFADLKARLQKAIDYVASFSPGDIEGSEDRDIALRTGGKDVTQKGLDYLLNRAMPNFYFHVTTAYAILRHNGVPVGKGDYIG